MPAMKFLWLTSLVVLCCLPLHAQTTELPSTSGNAFVRICSGIQSGEVSFRTGTCVAYIDGFVSGLQFETLYAQDKAGEKVVPSLFCAPEKAEYGQVIRILLKYI